MLSIGHVIFFDIEVLALWNPGTSKLNPTAAPQPQIVPFALAVLFDFFTVFEDFEAEAGGFPAPTTFLYDIFAVDSFKIEP